MAKSTDLQNWRKIAQSWWSKGSKKTFSRPAGLSGTFSILRPALLLFLGIMSTFSILFGSGTLFFSSQTQFLLLYGSNMFFFLSQTQVTLPSWHYVNLFLFYTGLVCTFSTLGPDFCFYAGLIRSFSLLRPGVLFSSGIMSTFFPFSTGLARDFSPLELRLFLLSAPDSNLFDDSSHIFQHCFIPFSHLSGILIIVKRKSPLTQFLFHNMAGKYPTSYRLLLLFIK